MSSTIKDVAKRAGVSVATVSRVLNGNSNVAEATTKKVLKVVEEMSYNPNFLGRNLRKRETNIILVIAHSCEHSMYSQFITGMEKVAWQEGYDIISTSVNYNERDDLRRFSMLFNRTVDGVVLIGTHYKADFLNKIADSYHVALVGEAVEDANILTVVVDDKQAAYDAVKCLIEKGHTRIGLVTGGDWALSCRYRKEGYKKALEEHNIECDEDLIFSRTYDPKNGELAFDYFKSLPNPPTAVFCVSDLLAATFMKRAGQAGLQVGRDIAVMGFDNITFCEMFSPSLSTVNQPAKEMGQYVMSELITDIRTNKFNREYHTMPHKIILRESTGD